MTNVMAVGLVNIGDTRQGVGAPRHKMEPVTLAQIAALEGTFRGRLAPEVGDVQRVEITVMILFVGSTSRLQGRVADSPWENWAHQNPRG